MGLSSKEEWIAIIQLLYFWTLCVDGRIEQPESIYFGNLALNKRTELEPTWDDTNKDVGKENAVDGLYNDRGTGGQCAISADNALTAMWYVDLGSVLSITHVDIYYRTDNKQSPTIYTSRMAGFFLYISNTTSKEDGYLCFHEIQNKTGTPLEDQSIKCPVHGRYVIYYNERRPDVEYPSYYSKFAYVELCEVEVYGCKETGYFGDDCSLACPINCQERRCHIQTGYCLGCLPGYREEGCNKICGRNTYGLECALSCGSCNDGKPCNNINGTCHLGCNEGVEGNICQKVCELGYYGTNCDNTCSENCYVPRRCDIVTGQCSEGCKAGWNTITCKEKCTNGTFGQNCLRECGHCLDGDHCNYINGSCLKGCSSGYKGQLCRDRCSAGYFGINCLHKCSAFCKGNASCNYITGVCDEGCQDRRSGPLCGEGTSSGINLIYSSFVLQVAVFAIGKGVLRFTRN